MSLKCGEVNVVADDEKLVCSQCKHNSDYTVNCVAASKKQSLLNSYNIDSEVI